MLRTTSEPWKAMIPTKKITYITERNNTPQQYFPIFSANRQEQQLRNPLYTSRHSGPPYPLCARLHGTEAQPAA
jgi:hypothetical protein